MTAELLAGISGTVVSVLFSYLPGLSGAYDGLGATYKRLVMAGVLLVVTAAVYGLSCAGIYQFFACDQAGIIKAVEIFVAALVANQATYLITPEVKRG